MKKPSAANSPSRLPESVVFFLDRSLGKKVVSGRLRKAGALVEVHDDHFPQDAKDEIWLKVVGEKGWIVLTRDQRIRYRQPELRALLQNGVRAFVLMGKDLGGLEMAEIFARALPRMRQFLAKNRSPFIAAITRDGNVRLILKAPKPV